MPQLVRLMLITLTLACQQTFAEIYISRGPNGERLISDRPPHQADKYKIIMQRDTLDHAGHILANRPIEIGGPDQFRQYINGASDRFNVEPALIEAVIQVESGFDPNAVSKKGATGLMQLMRQTANQYEVKDRFNPRDNIYAGVAHLSTLIEQYEGEIPLVLAAYNAGGTAVERHNGIPPYPETLHYIDKVMINLSRFRQARYDGL